MTRRIVQIMALALAGCGAQVNVEPMEEAATVCPGASTVEGIDVSQYQGTIDWTKVKAAGKQFAIIRVSDGTGSPDPYFASNWANAKKAGLIRGAYQFFEPGGDAVAQANLLLSKMGTIGSGDLPPMIDVEVTGGQSGATIAAKIQQWINTIHAATGRNPLIYTGTWFWDPNVGSSAFKSYPLVESYYCSNCCPNLPKPWSTFSMWQYSSTGAVSGISGNVDLDKFNGTLQQLQVLAGGAPWAAQYVSQSWPLASTSLKMIVGQTVAASLTLRNVGSKSWDSNTRLGTTMPHDRASAFADASWLSSSRADQVTGTVAPGASYKFSFNFHAPDKPGSYKEYFDLVQEKVAWFSDPGQGGPADNQLEAWIEVVAPNYSGQFTAQSFTAATKAPVMVGLGQTVDGWIELKNTGAQPWKAGVTKLAPTPRDKPSPIADASWLSPTRVSTVAADVAPGQVGHFPLAISGNTEGDFTQTFALLEEGVTWFSDKANGGGPADDFIKVHVVVTATPQDPPLGDDAGAVADLSPGGNDDGGATDQPPVGGGGNDDNGATPPSGSCAMGGDVAAPVVWPMLLFLVLGVTIRFRRTF